MEDETVSTLRFFFIHVHPWFNPNSEVAGVFIGILTTDGTDFHGFKNTTNRFENVSITLTSSVPFRAIRGLISVFGFKSSWMFLPWFSNGG
jgi:hypothetical protein